MAQKREKGGTIRGNIEAQGRKTSSDGFKQGGAIIKRAKGGSLEKWAKEEEKEPEHKATGGAVKRKQGGAVPGAPSAPTLAYRARGGRTSAPFSSGRGLSGRAGSGSSGHESE